MNNKITTPKAKDWNNYWSLDGTERFTKVSWSKRRIMNVLNPYVAVSKSALDAGCGSGFFSKYFCDQGIKTVSLDYSDDALKIAERMTEGRAELQKFDLVTAIASQQIKNRFDLIFTDGLMEHFPKDEQDKIVINLRSLLTPKGVLVTFVPNRWSPWELIRPFYMPGIEEDPFVMKELLDLNCRNGLAVLKSGGLNTLPFAFSPDRLCGHIFGMLLFTISKSNHES